MKHSHLATRILFSFSVIVGASAFASNQAHAFGLGLTTQSLNTDSNGSISALFDFTPSSSLQTYIGIATTSPVFVFSVGGNFRHMVAGSQNLGLHVGGGISLGTAAAGGGTLNADGTLKTTLFNLAFGPIGGISFALPNLSALKFTLDAGPILLISDGTANFAMTNLSSALGLSVHYML